MKYACVVDNMNYITKIKIAPSVDKGYRILVTCLQIQWTKNDMEPSSGSLLDV